jgi:hypothetical protein
VKWIEEFGKGSPDFLPEARAVMKEAALAANDLMDYRHALIHGAVLAFEGSTIATFIRNPGWQGVKRARPTNDAHVDENLLDIAIDAVSVLCRTVFAAREACEEASGIHKLIALRDVVDSARSEARELRHLRDLMNHEKY